MLLSSEVRGSDESLFLSETFTITSSPIEALDSSSGVDNNFDFISTSGFEEWDHSHEVETHIFSGWSLSGGDKELETSRESDRTIVTSRFTIFSFQLIGVHWETVGNLHVFISNGSLDSNVEMEESLDSSWSSGTGGNLEEDITELLGRRSESTSTSDSGQMGWHVHDGIELD
jgi:hypothetical protein